MSAAPAVHAAAPASNQAPVPQAPTARPIGGPPDPQRSRRLVHDSILVTIGGQLERVVGLLTALSLRWGLDPAHLGVYTGLRVYLDQTNRSSLGIGQGAVQAIPILRAAGRDAEAQHIANVAHTASALSCAVYALALVGWAAIRRAWLAGEPLAAEWTWGLLVMAGLTLLQRHVSFQIALLRAHGRFAETTQIDLFEAAASSVLVGAGVWLGGFWGLLAGVTLLFLAKILYLRWRHPLDLTWTWDGPVVVRLLRTGWPIFVNTAVFGMLLNLDRVLILWVMPSGERAAGLYTVALLGTTWCLDVAGRIVLVLYTHFQTTLGATGRPGAVIEQAARATEALAPILAAGCAVVYVIGPDVLSWIVPRYVEGLPTLRPLLLGTYLLSLSWPSRQLLITTGGTARLLWPGLLGLVVALGAGWWGARVQGLVGLTWGISLGYAVQYLSVSYLGLRPRRFWRVQRRVATACLGSLGVAAVLAPEVGVRGSPGETAVRLAILLLVMAPGLWLWGHRHGWGGVFGPRRGPGNVRGGRVRP